MAMLMDTSEGYTRTGNGLLTRIASGASFIPNWLGGGFITKWLGFGDTALESGKYLLNGDFGGAASSALAGTVGTIVNIGESIPFFWPLNAASGLLTGATLGTHARKITEEVVGALGIHPKVSQANFAAVGSIGGGISNSNVGRRDGWVGAEAGRRGQNVDDAWARINSNDADHVAALNSAARGGYQLG